MIVFLVALCFAVICWSFAVTAMWRGWRRRGEKQLSSFGAFPEVPPDFGDIVYACTSGLYVGSTMAPNWSDRITFGDLGYRGNSKITWYKEGILISRSQQQCIWIPITAVRDMFLSSGLAGKVMLSKSLLVIRWNLPSGVQIDTGLRFRDKRLYSQWLEIWQRDYQSREVGVSL